MSDRPMRHWGRVIVLLLAPGSLFAGAEAETTNWPQFRGPFGNGVATSRDLPLRWSETENVKWKTLIHDRGWSSPVIWDRQVWMTTATEDGRRLCAVCVDQESGEVVYDLELFAVAEPQFCHRFNSYASPTPVVEEGRVYVTFGSPGTACLDTRTAQVLWRRSDLPCNHFRGAGSSPILFRDLLLLHFDGSDLQYVVALDKQTGKTVWRAPRSIDFRDLTPDGQPEAEGDLRKAFSTPHVAWIDGNPQMLSLGAKAAYAYNPRTGEELWRVEERNQHSASTRPVYSDGLVFYPTGFARGQLYAVRPVGRGDETATHVVWVCKRNVPNKPSILLVDDLIYMIDDGGVASCLEAKTGAQVWNERVGGNYSASPIYAGGRIYFSSEEGKTTVLKAGRTFEVLATNHLENGFMASPAASGQALFLRTKTHLYRIESGGVPGRNGQTGLNLNFSVRNSG